MAKRKDLTLIFAEQIWTSHFRKVNLILTSEDESYVIVGYANNSNIDAEYKNDAYTEHVGAKGGDDVAWAVNNDRSGTIKFWSGNCCASCHRFSSRSTTDLKRGERYPPMRDPSEAHAVE